MMDEGTGERWKAVAGAPGYEVSDAGRVRSYRKKYGLRETPVLLSPAASGPRLLVSMRYEDGKRRSPRVHSLVLEAFRGPRPPGCEGCHNDGDFKNNRVENLRWDTHRNNLADRVLHKTLRWGESHPNTALRGEDRQTVRSLLRRGFPVRRIARFYGLHPNTVRRVKLPDESGAEDKGRNTMDGVKI